MLDGQKTLPAKVRKISDPDFPSRIPSIHKSKNIEDSWLSISITEGKHRQVRRMTARIGHPTLRLIRIRIKKLLLDGLPSGKVRVLLTEEIESLKK